ncbi:unnamed protein product [Lepeophtheirus salmonis]|uniref:(salmon louse) hypothetical protein n=1 Tax=Lepeophtheirus salmonis TaxID=72036 RepID=A0A7R8H6C6_LEPSM|nr:unnamed protein product [Lepeophtheirus salmonis]CAF2897044.1 unnamed protein product [Lepeophtheirus salmonis]
MVQLLKEKGHNVEPGRRTCIIHYKPITPSIEMYVTTLETEDDFDFAICGTPRKKVNLSLEAAGVFPIHLHAIPQHARLLAANVKLSKVMDKFYTKFDRDSIHKAAGLDRLHNKIKEKLTTASYPEKFRVSKYLIRKAKDLKPKKIIPAMPNPKREFHYSKWQTTDPATLATLVTTYDEYKQLLIEFIYDRCGQYHKSRKEILDRTEIQRFHWSKIYCTLHPIVIYVLDDEGNLKYDSLCFVSNDNTYDTAFVYEAQTINEGMLTISTATLIFIIIPVAKNDLH